MKSPLDMTATELLQNDHAFRVRVMSAVHEAVNDFEKDRPEEIEMRDVHDVAFKACVTALKRAFDEDAEISRLRVENARYKELALSGLTMPAPAYILETK